MTNRMHLNLALVAIAAGLGVAVYLSQEKEEKGAPLTGLTVDSIDRVSIEHPGAPALVLAKTGKDWKLMEPVQAPADAIEINGVLNLATLETKSTLALADVKLADLGLAPPQYTVTLNDQQLELGTTDPLNYRRYIKKGDNIVLTEDPPSAALDADYSDLVSKQLLPEGAEILSIAMPGLTAARSADGKTWDLQPAQANVSADRKQKLIASWQDARSMWNAAQVDGEPLPEESVTVTLKNQTLRFVIAERDPQFVLVRPDLKVRYTLSKALADEMLKLPPEEKAAEVAPAQ